MGKKKRGSGKKKSGRRGAGGEELSTASPGRGSDGEFAGRQSLAGNDAAAPPPTSISDENIMHLLAEDQAHSEGAGMEAVRSIFSLTRMIADLGRMAGECEEKRHECWICLSDEADESGRLPMRDCSCRGDDLGHAHVECLKEYARKASLDTNEGRSDKLLPPDEQFEARRFNVHWEKCSICCQPYQHALAKELADTLIEFIAQRFSIGPLVTSYRIPSLDPLASEMYINACLMKIVAITTMDYWDSPKLQKEGEAIARKMLAMVYTQSSPHPTNIALGLKKIGLFLGASKETYKEGIAFFERAIAVYKSIGRESSIAIAKSNIDKIKIEHERQSQMPKEDQLKNSCDSYDYFMTSEGYGEDSMMGIKAGLLHSKTLATLGRGIEGERLATKTLATCARVLGDAHDITREMRSTAKFCKARRAKVATPNMRGDVVAIRYEDEGRRLVVRNTKGRCFSGSPRDLVFWDGTPVVCHSLQDSDSHLNGKIGDARDYNKEDETYNVYFEDKSLGSVVIKRGHLNILFELPAAPTQGVP